jgi:hypothetical protein
MLDDGIVWRLASLVAQRLAAGLLSCSEWLRFLKACWLYLAVYAPSSQPILLAAPGYLGLYQQAVPSERTRAVKARRAAHVASARLREPMALEVRGLASISAGLSGRRSRSSGAARGRSCPDRPQRQRQDNHGQCRDRALSSDRGRDFRRRRRRDNAARAQAHRRRPRADISEHSPVPVDDRTRKCRRRRRAGRQCAC